MQTDGLQKCKAQQRQCPHISSTSRAEGAVDVILPGGGDKRTQSADIAEAERLAEDL